MSRSYFAFTARRVGQAALVVLLAYVFTFTVITILPGDPISSQLRNPENGFSEAEIAQLVAYYGLDRPVLEQLAHSLGGFLVGDLGLSLRTQLPVSQLIADAVPPASSRSAARCCPRSTGRGSCGRSRRCSSRCRTS
jgi:peptide/nickel transport system permease protein